MTPDLPAARILTAADEQVLDNIGWSALTGREAPFAVVADGLGRARRFPAAMSPFAGVPSDADASDWAALATLVQPGEAVGLANREVPDGWFGFAVPCDQLIDSEVGAGDEGAAELAAALERVIRLGESDVPEMLDLVERTQPGPFAPRTIDFGGYVGIRVDGRLAAMAGERLHPDGWSEVSAVCTDPDFRGRGFARTVVAAVVAGVRARGERAFLHVAVGNDGAKRVYEALGFRVRTRYDIAIASPHPLPDAAH